MFEIRWAVTISPTSTEDDPFGMGPSPHGNKPRVDSVPPDRLAKLLDTERSSRNRKQGSARELAHAVEALPQEILKELVKLVPPSPSTRHKLVQAEVFGLAAVIVKYAPFTLEANRL